MRQYKKYTDQDIIKYSKNVISIAGLLKKLKLKPVGGNYYTIKRKLKELDIDTKHWKYQGWNKGEQLKNWKDYKISANIRKHLIKLNNNMCNKCKNIKWMGKDIPIELHHIDGDRTNNDFKNLELLCPNCHALTENWKNRKCRTHTSA